MKVWIAQLLCPSRHCVLACAGEYVNAEDAEVMREMLQRSFDEAVRHGYLNPWCGLCQSRELHIEIGATRFTTLAEATPALRENEANQAATAQFLKQGNN